MRRLTIGSLLALAMLVFPLSATAGGHWTDPTGDSGTAQDITTVDVANDAAGNVTFTVGVTPATIASNEGIGLYIDSDLNAGTGISYRYRPGIDYLVFLYSGGAWDFYAPSNGSMVSTAHGSMSVSVTSTGFTVTLNKSQLGGSSSFRFWIQTQQASPGGSLAASDLAPDAGSAGYTYTLTTFSKVVVGLLPGSAAKGVHPGARFGVAARIGLSDGTTVAADSVSCKASVSGRPLPAAGTCTWKVPKTAAGKRIVVTVTAGYGGESHATTVSIRVLRK